MASKNCRESWAIIQEMCCDSCVCTQKEWYLTPFYSFDGKTMWGEWRHLVDNDYSRGGAKYLAISEDKIPVWQSDFKYVFDYASLASGKEIKTPAELTEWFKKFLDDYLPAAHTEEYNRIITLIQNGINAKIGGSGKNWWIHDDYSSVNPEKWVTYDRMPDSKYDLEDVLHHYTRHIDHGVVRYVRDGVSRHSLFDLVSSRLHNTQLLETQTSCSYLPYPFLNIKGLPRPSQLSGTYEMEYCCYDDGNGTPGNADDASIQWCQDKYCSPQFGTTISRPQTCLFYDWQYNTARTGTTDDECYKNGKLLFYKITVGGNGEYEQYPVGADSGIKMPVYEDPATGNERVRFTIGESPEGCPKLSGRVADIFLPPQLTNLILGDTYNFCFTPKYLVPAWTLKHETCKLVNPNDDPKDVFAPKIQYAGSTWEATSDTMGVLLDVTNVNKKSPYFNCVNRYTPIQITDYTVRPKQTQIRPEQAQWADDRTSLNLNLDCDLQNQLPDNIWVSHGAPAQPEFQIPGKEDEAVKIIDDAVALKYKRYASTHTLLIKQNIEPYAPLPDYPDEVHKRNLSKELEHRLTVIDARREEIKLLLEEVSETLAKLQGEWNIVVAANLAELNAAEKELKDNNERIQAIDTALINGWYPAPDTILTENDKKALALEKEEKEKRNTDLENKIIPDLQFVYDNTRQGSQEIKNLVKQETDLNTELDSYDEKLINDNVKILTKEVEEIWDQIANGTDPTNIIQTQIDTANSAIEQNQQRIDAINNGLETGIHPDTEQALTPAEYQMLLVEKGNLETQNKKYHDYIDQLTKYLPDGTETVGNSIAYLIAKKEELREWKKKQRQFIESDDEVWDLLDDLEKSNESLMKYYVEKCGKCTQDLIFNPVAACTQQMAAARVQFEAKRHTRVPYSWVSNGLFGGYISTWEGTPWEKQVKQTDSVPYYTGDGQYSWGNPMWPTGGTMNCDVPKLFQEYIAGQGYKIKFSDEFIKFLMTTEPWIRLSQIWLEFNWTRDLIDSVMVSNRDAICTQDYYDPGTVLNPYAPLEPGKCYSLDGWIGHVEVSYGTCFEKCEPERKEVELFDAAGRLLQAQGKIILLYYPIVKNPMSNVVHSYMWKHPIDEYTAVYRKEDDKQIKILTNSEYSWESGDPSTRTNLDISTARGYKAGQPVVGRHVICTSRLTLGGMECLSHYIEKGLMSQEDSEDSTLHSIQEEINQLQAQLSQMQPGSGDYIDIQNKINNLMLELMRIKNEPEENRYRSRIDWENRVIPLSAVQPIGIVGKTLLYQVSGFAPSTPRLTNQTHYISDWRKKNDPLVNRYYFSVADPDTGQSVYYLKEGADTVYSPIEPKSVKYWEIIHDENNKWQKKSAATSEEQGTNNTSNEEQETDDTDEELWVDDPDHINTVQFLCWFDGRAFIQKPYIPSEPLGGMLLKSDAHCYVPTLSSRAPENTTNTNTEDFDIYNPFFHDRKNGVAAIDAHDGVLLLSILTHKTKTVDWNKQDITIGGIKTSVIDNPAEKGDLPFWAGEIVFADDEHRDIFLARKGGLGWICSFDNPRPLSKAIEGAAIIIYSPDAASKKSAYYIIAKHGILRATPSQNGVEIIPLGRDSIWYSALDLRDYSQYAAAQNVYEANRTQRLIDANTSDSNDICGFTPRTLLGLRLRLAKYQSLQEKYEQQSSLLENKDYAALDRVVRAYVHSGKGRMICDTETSGSVWRIADFLDPSVKGKDIFPINTIPSDQVNDTNRRSNTLFNHDGGICINLNTELEWKDGSAYRKVYPDVKIKKIIIETIEQDAEEQYPSSGSNPSEFPSGEASSEKQKIHIVDILTDNGLMLYCEISENPTEEELNEFTINECRMSYDDAWVDKPVLDFWNGLIEDTEETIATGKQTFKQQTKFIFDDIFQEGYIYIGEFSDDTDQTEIDENGVPLSPKKIWELTRQDMMSAPDNEPYGGKSCAVCLLDSPYDNPTILLDYMGKMWKYEDHKWSWQGQVLSKFSTATLKLNFNPTEDIVCPDEDAGGNGDAYNPDDCEPRMDQKDPYYAWCLAQEPPNNLTLKNPSDKLKLKTASYDSRISIGDFDASDIVGVEKIDDLYKIIDRIRSYQTYDELVSLTSTITLNETDKKYFDELCFAALTTDKKLRYDYINSIRDIIMMVLIYNRKYLVRSTRSIWMYDGSGWHEYLTLTGGGFPFTNAQQWEQAMCWDKDAEVKRCEVQQAIKGVDQNSQEALFNNTLSPKDEPSLSEYLGCLNMLLPEYVNSDSIEYKIEQTLSVIDTAMVRVAGKIKDGEDQYKTICNIKIQIEETAMGDTERNVDVSYNNLLSVLYQTKQSLNAIFDFTSREEKIIQAILNGASQILENAIDIFSEQRELLLFKAIVDKNKNQIAVSQDGAWNIFNNIQAFVATLMSDPYFDLSQGRFFVQFPCPRNDCDIECPNKLDPCCPQQTQLLRCQCQIENSAYHFEIDKIIHEPQGSIAFTESPAKEAIFHLEKWTLNQGKSWNQWDNCVGECSNCANIVNADDSELPDIILWSGNKRNTSELFKQEIGADGTQTDVWNWAYEVCGQSYGSDIIWSDINEWFYSSWKLSLNEAKSQEREDNLDAWITQGKDVYAGLCRELIYKDYMSIKDLRGRVKRKVANQGTRVNGNNSQCSAEPDQGGKSYWLLTEFAPKIILDREAFIRKKNVELEELQQKLQDMISNGVSQATINQQRDKINQYNEFLQQVKQTENLFDLYEIDIVLTNS